MILFYVFFVCIYFNVLIKLLLYNTLNIREFINLNQLYLFLTKMIFFVAIIMTKLLVFIIYCLLLLLK